MLMSGVRKEAAVRLLEAEKPRSAYRGCDVSINHTPGGVFGKDLDRVVFRFLSTRYSLEDSEALWRTPGIGTHDSG